MSIERIIRSLAGFVILLSLVLAHVSGQADLGSLSWLWLTGLAGANLLQSGFTGFCPPEKLLRKLGFKSDGGACCG